jgi:hypothetical protein
MSTEQKPVDRSSGGLRAALFDEIDALRRGESNAARARSVAMLANSVLQSVSAEIEYHKYVSDATKASTAQKLGVLELAPGSVNLSIDGAA